MTVGNIQDVSSHPVRINIEASLLLLFHECKTIFFERVYPDVSHHLRGCMCVRVCLSAGERVGVSAHLQWDHMRVTFSRPVYVCAPEWSH